jgi:hypothetical protein
MNSEIDPKVSQMSDLAIARNIIVDTFDLGHTPRPQVIGRTIAALKRVERALAPEVLRERTRLWTERRVRSIIDNEARRIEHYEIDDLTKMKLAEARLAYQRSRDRSAQLAAFLEAQDADFHSDEIDRLGQLARGLGRAGTGGTE